MYDTIGMVKYIVSIILHLYGQPEPISIGNTVMLKYQIVYKEPSNSFNRRLYYFRHGYSHRIDGPSEISEHDFYYWSVYGRLQSYYYSRNKYAKERIYL